jgi:hypothetical protein
MCSWEQKHIHDIIQNWEIGWVRRVYHLSPSLETECTFNWHWIRRGKGNELDLSTDNRALTNTAGFDHGIHHPMP